MATLRKGDKGDDVRRLQLGLVKQGYKISADGIFGQGTTDAVVAFQKASGLIADGLAGNATQKALGVNPTTSILDTIPMPSANRSRAAAMPTLVAVGNITSLSPDLLATFASIESAFDYLVKASTSSATGWFQHLNKTWDDILAMTFARYGLKDSVDRRLRLDPRANALMGAELLKDNARILRNTLGREPTDTELYVAHFFGAGVAKQFITANRKAIGVKLFPKQAEANVGIFYARDKKTALTIAEIMQVFENKVAGHRR